LARESSPKELPIFSRKKLLDELDGDEMLMRRMILLFQESTPRLLEDIRGSIARHASGDLARSTLQLETQASRKIMRTQTVSSPLW
jgi:hypothetical protein